MIDLRLPQKVVRPSNRAARCQRKLWGCCAAGCEDGSLRLWDARCSRPVVEVIRACSTRIKGVAAASAESAAQGSGGGSLADTLLAATASSDGLVRLWDMRAVASNRQAACASHRQADSITCHAIKSHSSQDSACFNTEQSCGPAGCWQRSLRPPVLRAWCTPFRARRRW